MVLEVEAGWSQAEVARRFRVSRATVAKWWRRYREEGAAGLRDRSSAPRSNPRRTAAALEQRICACAAARGAAPHRLGARVARPLTPCSGAAASTASTAAPREQAHAALRAPRPRRPRREEAGPHPRGRRAPRTAAPPRPRAPAASTTSTSPSTTTGAYVAVLPDERGSCAAFLEQALCVRPPWRARARRADRQREGLHRLPRLPRRGRRRWRGTAAHPALPPADERQGRALHPDPAERVGLRPPLPLQRERSSTLITSPPRDKSSACPRRRGRCAPAMLLDASAGAPGIGAREARGTR